MIRFEDVHWGGSTRLGSGRSRGKGAGSGESGAESRQLGCCFIKISPRPSRETNSSNVPAKQFKTLSRFVRAESHLGGFSDTILNGEHGIKYAGYSQLLFGTMNSVLHLL